MMSEFEFNGSGDAECWDDEDWEHCVREEITESLNVDVDDELVDCYIEEMRNA